jgi:hypothetical protein
MEPRIAMFIHGDGVYYPANKHATGVCSILSKMRLTDKDMLGVRSEGYIPMLTNGKEIGEVKISV